MGHIGRILERVRPRVAVKLSLCLVLGATAIFAVFGYFNQRTSRRGAEELILQAADRMSDVILRSTRYQMMQNDREALYQMIRDIGNEPGITRVRIFSKDGRIRFSTEPSEVDTVVDKQAEACYACHALAEPLSRLDRPDRARVFSRPDGGRVLALIRPIENEPGCSSAACHAHPPEQRVLGVIDTHLSLAVVDAHMARYQRQLAQFGGGAILLILAASLVFVWLVVHRPIGALAVGTRRVARGDLGYRIAVRSRDEVGELADSFNHMTEKLEAAHAELTNWARTLEERVEKKTRELEKAHAVLVSSEKMASLGKLAAVVAHEVNNPLSGIMTYARLNMREIEKMECDPAVKRRMIDQLRVIERESRRCGEIMRNLLTFARQAPRDRQANDVNEIVRRAVTLIRHQLDLHEIQLETRLDRNLPLVVCDGGQIQQVILGLLSNASDAMEEGGNLVVSTERDPEGDGVRISVADNGPGIAAEVLPQIFEPFFTTKEDQHRTGLGLAVARNIMEQHGGSIEVESAEGEGAQFTLVLPLEVKTAVESSAARENE